MAIPVLGILFAKGAKTEILGARSDIPVDAFITRSHSFSSSVTRAPVEDGSNINDHVILDPDELTIEGLTSDHPVDLLAGLTAVAGAVVELFGGDAAPTRSRQAAEALEEAWRDKAELEIVTRLKTYKSMVIESLEWNESAEVGEALAFRMRLIKIRKVSLQLVPSSGLLDAVGDLAEGPVEAGKQAPKPKPKPTAPAVTSLSQASEMVNPASVGSGF